MAAPLVITHVRPGLLGTKIRIYAEGTDRSRRSSLLGERVFTIREGQALTLRVRTSHWKVGEHLTLDQLLNSARDWTDIPWDWEP